MVEPGSKPTVLDSNHRGHSVVNRAMVTTALSLHPSLWLCGWDWHWILGKHLSYYKRKKNPPSCNAFPFPLFSIFFYILPSPELNLPLSSRSWKSASPSLESVFVCLFVFLCVHMCLFMSSCMLVCTQASIQAKRRNHMASFIILHLFLRIFVPRDLSDSSKSPRIS